MVMRPPGRLLLVFGCGRQRVEVRETTDNEDMVVYHASVSEIGSSSIALPRWQTPSVALVGNHLLLWAGVLLKVTEITTGEGVSCETSEEIVDVMNAGSGWCIVRELGVEVRSADLTLTEARYEHGEIIIGCQWDDDGVSLIDLQHREVALTLPQLDRRA
jgi:hypothetical protein